jgi:hypothetical protein
MAAEALYASGYKPSFSGHETFPPRYGWLRKGYNAVDEAASSRDAKAVFTSETSIARFGVGKNMVASIRHWCELAGVIEACDDGEGLRRTSFGTAIFGQRGADPYLEEDDTIWLLHWRIAANIRATAWFWLFNHFTQSSFSRAELIEELQRLGQAQSWPRLSETTIKRDIDCLVRTYAGGRGGSWGEESADSPLAELGLVRPMGSRDRFQIVRGPKPTLSSGVFLCALTRFFEERDGAGTASLESLGYEPRSPGRIFVLDEDDLAHRLSEIETTSEGAFRWSETAGLKQVVRVRAMPSKDALKLALREMGARRKKKDAA